MLQGKLILDGFAWGFLNAKIKRDEDPRALPVKILHATDSTGIEVELAFRQEDWQKFKEVVAGEDIKTVEIAAPGALRALNGHGGHV